MPAALPNTSAADTQPAFIPAARLFVALDVVYTDRGLGILTEPQQVVARKVAHKQRHGQGQWGERWFAAGCAILLGQSHKVRQLHSLVHGAAGLQFQGGRVGATMGWAQQQAKRRGKRAATHCHAYAMPAD